MHQFFGELIKNLINSLLREKNYKILLLNKPHKVFTREPIETG